MQLVRFDHLAQNGVEIKFLNTLTCSGECLGVVGVVRSAFWGPLPLGDCPLLGHTGSPSAKRGVWGILPHYRVYLSPCAERGVWGESSPHYRVYLAPLC